MLERTNYAVGVSLGFCSTSAVSARECTLRQGSWISSTSTSVPSLRLTTPNPIYHPLARLSAVMSSGRPMTSTRRSPSATGTCSSRSPQTPVPVIERSARTLPVLGGGDVSAARGAGASKPQGVAAARGADPCEPLQDSAARGAGMRGRSLRSAHSPRIRPRLGDGPLAPCLLYTSPSPRD